MFFMYFLIYPALKKRVKRYTCRLDIRLTQRWHSIVQIFWDITPSTDVSEEQIASTFRVEEWAKKALLVPCFFLASCLDYSSILMMKTVCSSETSVHFSRTTPLVAIFADQRTHNIFCTWKRMRCSGHELSSSQVIRNCAVQNISRLQQSKPHFDLLRNVSAIRPNNGQKRTVQKTSLKE
jgi:hypothetical protein